MNKIVLYAKTLGLIAFFSTMPIYSPNVAPMQEHLQNNAEMGCFITPMLVSIAAASSFLFVHASISTARLEKPIALYSSVAPFGYVACMTYFIFTSTGPLPTETTLMALCGIVVGTCLPPMAIEWGKQFMALPLQQALLLVCAVCGSTAAVNWLFTFLPPAPLAAAFFIMTVVGTFFPRVFPVVLRLSRTKTDMVSANSERESVVPSASDTKPETKTSSRKNRHSNPLLIPRFVSVLISALVGLSVFAFHMGVSRESIFDSVSIEALGNIIASLALLPLCFVKKSQQPVSVLLFSKVAPIVSVILLSYMAISNDLGAQSDFVSTGIYAFFCMIAQASLALGIAATHAREFSTPMIWSGFLAIFSIFSIAGLSLGAFLSKGQPFMLQAITGLYCAYLVIQSIHSLWKNGAMSNEGSAPSDERQDYAHRCEKLAADFLLSPRESEIATYLGRGHTCSYIAKTLVISESTVYTHARNIYRKVGIQSKEELVQMLSGESLRQTADPL